MDEDRLERLVEAHEDGSTLYECSECGELIDEGDVVEIVRECPHCETPFNGDENGRACPDCNRTFSRFLHKNGCPECLAEASEYMVSPEEQEEIDAFIAKRDADIDKEEADEFESENEEAQEGSKP